MERCCVVTVSAPAAAESGFRKVYSRSCKNRQALCYQFCATEQYPDVFFNDDTRQENCVSATADDCVRRKEKLMTSEASVPPTPVKGTDLAERLAQHLVGRPQDLIDARRLMRCFRIHRRFF